MGYFKGQIWKEKKKVISALIPLVRTLTPPYLEAGLGVAGKRRLPVASSETQTELDVPTIILHSVKVECVYFFFNI